MQPIATAFYERQELIIALTRAQKPVEITNFTLYLRSNLFSLYVLYTIVHDTCSNIRMAFQYNFVYFLNNTRHSKEEERTSLGHVISGYEVFKVDRPYQNSIHSKIPHSSIFLSGVRITTKQIQIK